MPGGKPRGRGEIESVYYAEHDLRAVFSRENANRRRESGHTLRKYLTEKQDRQALAKFVKIRDEYEITNNSDAIAVWVQQMVAAGKGDDIDPELRFTAAEMVIPKRVPEGEQDTPAEQAET